MRKLLAVLVLFSTLRAVPAAPADRSAQVAAALEASLAKFDRHVDGKGDIPTRSLANAALAALLLSGDGARAASYLDAELAVQRDDGSIPWYSRGPAIEDPNSIDFGTQSWGPILLEFSNRLPGDVRTALAGHARAALPVLLAHHVDVSYTNIYLLNAADVELIGEALHDASAQAYAQARLDRWLAYTQTAGIHEYNSPQYYGIDLSALEMGYRYSREPRFRALLQRILPYVWTDVAAHHLRPLNRSIGAHSRDYSFVGEGPDTIDAYTFLAGWGDDPLRDLNPDAAYALVAAGTGGYLPDAQISSIVDRSVRIVQGRWNTDSSAWRYTYATPAYAIGCANGSYGQQDKLVAIDIARGSQDLQIAPVVTAPDQDPYGVRKQPDRTGHNKPAHDRVAPALAADRNRLIADYDVPAGDTFSVLMPLDASVTQLPGGASVTLAEPGAVANVRIDVAGATTGSLLRDGGDTGAMRYAIEAMSPLHVTVRAVVGNRASAPPERGAFGEPSYPGAPLVVNGARYSP